MMNSKDDSSKEDEEGPLPGFRFHPTDDELVGFYLRRKVDKKPIRIELIKQIDIYKYDPWDLPKGSSVGDSESYFFCKRGRKYRNSIRPNRVTGSGFWKATGIDKPVYSHGGEGHNCIGLKKTLVYYRGSAGKGTKTDWMMHEFRLPSDLDTGNSAKTSLQEAEVWTLCRIFKRNVSSRKYTPDWRELATKRTHHTVDNNHLSSNKLHMITSQCNNINRDHQANYINFGGPITHHQYHHRHNNYNINNDDKKPIISHMIINPLQAHQIISSQPQPSPSVIPSACSTISNLDTCSSDDQLLSYGNWDELRPVVGFALDPPSIL